MEGQRHSEFHLIGGGGSKLFNRLRLRQYYPLIIDRTISRMLDPYTDVHIDFLKHCTITNKAMGTIWRSLSKPPQRRQGPDIRPFWLLVGTPSAIRHELSSRWAEHNLPFSDVNVNIFIYNIDYLYAVCLSIFYNLSVWCGCWSVLLTNFEMRTRSTTGLLRGVERLDQ